MPKKYKSKLKRDVALRKLEALIDRVDFWNSNYSKYYRVDEVTLVGSLARNEQNVTDIDLCVKVSRTQEFSAVEHRNDYIKWRKEVLGYAPPRDFVSELYMYEFDVRRFIQNKDGRIDILQWDQLQPISLTMHPIVTLVHNGVLIFDCIFDAISKAKAITIEGALNIISGGVPEKPTATQGEYWESYCNSLSEYPDILREAILDRDSNTEHYVNCKNA